MTELEEITTGKDYKQLMRELAFQLRQGEEMGGNICSHILSAIKKQCSHCSVGRMLSMSKPSACKYCEDTDSSVFKTFLF